MNARKKKTHPARSDLFKRRINYRYGIDTPERLSPITNWADHLSSFLSRDIHHNLTFMRHKHELRSIHNHMHGKVCNFFRPRITQ